MIFKYIKPITSSQRHLIQIQFHNLKKKPMLKTKLKGFKNSNGRNNTGQITVRHKGGGVKKRYRNINFTRFTNTSCIITSLEYDPYRNAHIASVYDFINNTFFYIIAPKFLKVGDIIESGYNITTKLGNSLPISNIPVGSYIHNISINTSKHAQISRSAGTYSQLKEKTLTSAKIKLSSGKLITISPNCFAAIGIVSNENKALTKLGKAGRARWLNKRPSTRGVAMNPVDHPHGGGEGKKSGSGKTPWGKPTKKAKLNK